MSSFGIFWNQQSLQTVVTTRVKQWIDAWVLAWACHGLDVSLVESASLPSLHRLSERVRDDMAASL